MLAIAYNKFSQFIYGSHIAINGDLKPLEAIFKKLVSQTMPRLQCMLLNLLRYNFEVKYKRRKQMFLADALSRTYIKSYQSKVDLDLAEDIDVAVHAPLHDSALSSNTLVDLKAASDSDVILSQLRELVRPGCHKDVTKLLADLLRYLNIIADIHEINGVLLFAVLPSFSSDAVYAIMIPTTSASLSLSYDTYKEQLEERQQQQKMQYDRHGTRPL